MNGVLRYFARVGHVWIENPLSLLTFSVRFGEATLLAISRLVTPKRLQVLSKSMRQTVKAFMRGIVVIVGVGAFAGFGLGVVTAALGEILRPHFEAVIMPVVLRDVLPLLLALVLTARTGATIAAKFASSATRGSTETLTFGAHAIELEVLPQIVATVITSGAFFLILVACVGTGYFSGGNQISFSPADIQDFLSNETFSQAVVSGLWKSILYGAIVAYTACAFGIQAAERFISRREETYDLHYAVWESSVTSITMCVVLTILLWKEI
ncbi:MAG: ABC transporter permease [Ignavibacteriae bacterium]|nr:ABC transporter permease [Ignavibacteriota bacterium]